MRETAEIVNFAAQALADIPLFGHARSHKQLPSSLRELENGCARVVLIRIFAAARELGGFTVRERWGEYVKNTPPRREFR